MSNKHRENILETSCTVYSVDGILQSSYLVLPLAEINYKL